MNKLLFLIIAILIFTDSYGQGKLHILEAGPTGTVFKINDKAASALTYSNFIFGFNFEYIESSPDLYDAIKFHVQNGKLKNNISSASNLEATQFQFDWSKLWNLDLLRNSSQLLGFQWLTDYTNTRWENFSNNKQYFCFSSSLVPEIILKKDFVIHGLIHLSTLAKGSAGLFSYVIRPSIASTSPITPTETHPGNFWAKTTSGRLVSLCKLQQFNTSLSIELFKNKRIFTALEYNWSYFAYKVDNPYYEISHQFTILLGIRLK
jgi:hypothetical protein